MERLKGIKRENRGVTLIEIVVTIAILGIMAVPLINNFIVGMRTNNEARRTEEINQTAQDVAEAFLSSDLNSLFEQMNKGGMIQVGDYQNIQVNPIGTNTDGDKNLDKYELTFKNQVSSFLNKNYYVTASLEKRKEDSLPGIVDVGNANTLKICSEYFKHDMAYSPSSCGKSTELNITCKRTAADTYEYSISMDITYGSETKTDVYSVSRVVKKSEPETYINLFLLCNYFDTSSIESSDKITVKYHYDGGGSTQSDPPCQIYLYGQQIKDAAGHLVSLKPANVQIQHHEGDGLKVYSNVSGITGAETTTAKVNKMFTVYDLHIDVREGGTAGNVVAKLDTAVTR